MERVEFAPLNPEGQGLILGAAEEMTQELLNAHDGEHTDIFHARVLIAGAEKMSTELSEVVGMGPEVAVARRELQDAIEHLKDAIKQVH